MNIKDEVQKTSEHKLARKMSDMHPAEMGKLLRAVARAYKKRTGMKHPDFKSGIDACAKAFKQSQDYI